jgi:Tfp pilus assembly protein FimT
LSTTIGLIVRSKIVTKLLKNMVLKGIQKHLWMDSRGKANMKENRGFSLVELSMLLAMIALLTAFSVPVLTDSMKSMRLVSEARSIATTMTYAKLSAITKMTPYRLTFNITGNEWRLERYNRSTLSWELQKTVNKLEDGVANSQIAFKPSSSPSPAVEFGTTSSNTITFNSRGTPDEQDSIVYLSNNNQDYAVSVSLPGKIQLWKKVNNQWAAQ